MENHRRFHEALAARGHRIVMVSPLRAQCGGGLDAQHRAGSALVTDGPFTESVEQVDGFYLPESGDEADLLEVVRAAEARRPRRAPAARHLSAGSRRFHRRRRPASSLAAGILAARQDGSTSARMASVEVPEECDECRSR